MLGRIEAYQFAPCPFEIAFMFSRDGDFMILQEPDNIAVDITDIHIRPLSEPSFGELLGLSKGSFFLEVKGSSDLYQTRIFKG